MLPSYGVPSNWTGRWNEDTRHTKLPMMPLVNTRTYLFPPKETKLELELSHRTTNASSSPGQNAAFDTTRSCSVTLKNECLYFEENFSNADIIYLIRVAATTATVTAA